MNKVQLIGRIVRQYSEGMGSVNYVRNVIAIDSKRGENKRVDFIPFTAFGKTADLLLKFVPKGNIVYLEGEWAVSTYQKKDGTNATDHRLLVSNIEFLPNGKTESNPKEENTQVVKSAPIPELPSDVEIPDEELPF